MAEKGQESRPSLSKTNEETISSPRGNTWGYEETVSLLEVWAEDTIQRDNRKLNRFEIESDEQCEQWLLPETIAIGSRSIQSEHKAVSN